MTFDEAYTGLEQEFESRVEEDNKLWGYESIFLPNVMPAGPVDFVLVAMEPSLGRWAPGKTDQERLENAQKKITQGFRNFGSSREDDLLHYCIAEYLCQGDQTYYITDLSKGAMLTGEASKNREERCNAWYLLLKKELGLVAKPGAKIISIGATVRNFLAGKGFYGHAGTILHYAGTATGYRGKEISGREDLYREFSSRLQTLPNGKRLSDSQKKLMFDYMVSFKRIRNQDKSGWPSWQHRWQDRLASK